LLRAAALVLIGGLLTSTLLTLVFVPAIYTIFDDIQQLLIQFVRRLLRPRELAPEELALLRGYALPELDGVASSTTSGASHTRSGH
jgi:hypothetical protein